MCVNMCLNLLVNMRVNMCVNMCVTMFLNMCVNLCKPVCKHVCIFAYLEYLRAEIANWYGRTDMGSFLSCFATKKQNGPSLNLSLGYNM
jgi:hypothetical protein